MNHVVLFYYHSSSATGMKGGHQEKDKGKAVEGTTCCKKHTIVPLYYKFIHNLRCSLLDGRCLR